MDSLEVTVSVADAYLAQFDAVVLACEAVGLEVSQRLPTLGMVVGSIERAQLAALTQVEGVAAVEQVESFQLPPPENDLQ